jgi:hypothetical protein
MTNGAVSEKHRLHTVLAVSSDHEKVYRNTLAEAEKTFSKHGQLFEGYVKTLNMYSDDDAHLNGVFERQNRETTVGEKLDFTRDAIERFFDIEYQKDLANQEAVSDVIVDNKVMATDVPATFLLGMEKRLKHVRQLLSSIPTLDKGIEWVESKEDGKGVWKTKHPGKTFKDRKTKRFVEVSKATKEHKAQIEKWDDVERVGEYIVERFSGKITSARKSQYLGNLDRLYVAVKQARERANQVAVSKKTIAKTFMDYILAD